MTTLRRRTYEVLEAAKEDDSLSRVVDCFLIVLITLNVLAVILESMESLRAAHAEAFFLFEMVSVGIFTVEYGLRVWSSVEHGSSAYAHPLWGRFRYMRTPMAVLDLMVLLPVYLAFFVNVDLRFLRVLRLLRIFRLTRYASSMRLLVDVVRQEAANIGAALFILMMMVVFSASVIYLVEADVQPEAFGSIPDALWWAIVTMTTIGYGDVVPVTPWGKVFGSAIGVISVGLVALPTGLLASGFGQALQYRRQEFEDLIGEILADGKITAEDHEILREARDRLGLSDREAAGVLNTARQRLKHMVTECPHCGETIEPADPLPPRLQR